VLRALWVELGDAFAAALAGSGLDLQGFLKGLNPAWNLVGRCTSTLPENRRDLVNSLRFMDHLHHRLSAQAKAQHVPLGQALREYAGAANRDKLLSLLVPVQRASERCGWLKAMIDAGEISIPCAGDRPTPRDSWAACPIWSMRAWWCGCPASWRANRRRVPRSKHRRCASPSRSGL